MNYGLLASAVLWTLWTGHPDAALLKQFADSAGVPPIFAWAVAAVESGHHADNKARGTHGEIGRMQLKLLWTHAFKAECGSLPLTDYLTNICKGMFLLRTSFDATGSWEQALRRYNGAGPNATRYVRAVEQEIGRIELMRATRP